MGKEEKERGQEDPDKMSARDVFEKASAIVRARGERDDFGVITVATKHDGKELKVIYSPFSGGKDLSYLTITLGNSITTLTQRPLEPDEPTWFDCDDVPNLPSILTRLDTGQ